MSTDRLSAPPHRRAPSWLGVLTRTVSQARKDDISDWAAALTYYGVLSIFPALIVVASLLGLVGPRATQPLLDNLVTFAPGPARTILTNAMHGLTQSRGSAGVLFVVGLVGAVWAASGYFSAFMRAANAIWGVREGRPIWKTYPLQLAVTLLMLVLLAASAVAVVLTGPLADKAARLVGLGSAATTVWDVAKWPVLVVVVALMLAILYYAAPNVRQPSFRLLTPGATLAVIVWIVVSAAFAFYLANFGSYNKTYGALAAVIVFLVWLWLTNVAVLLGVELDAEAARRRRLEAGEPDTEPYLPPRDRPRS